MLEAFVDKYENVLFLLAEISAGILEFIGIVIIIIGTFRALSKLIRNFVRKKSFVNDVDLEKALSLSLEFKMGAEIIKTVIIHNLEELAILGVVIIIRALIALLIHWEIHIKEREKRLKAKTTTEETKTATEETK